MNASAELKNTMSLDDIIKSRSTQRKFSQTKIPSEGNIRQIIEAGIYAPFPSLGTDRKTSPRKFIVLKNGTSQWVELKTILTALGKKLYKLTKKQKLLRLINRVSAETIRINNDVIKDCEPYARMLAESKGDFAHFDTAPYWITIAEEHHMPFSMKTQARQSMGHCLQNIWLKATELGMIIQPISMIVQVQSKKRVCRILGLQKRNCELDSFLVGFPDKELRPAKREYNLDEDIIWLTNENRNI